MVSKWYTLDKFIYKITSKYNISCCLGHEQGISNNFLSKHAEMQSCADTEWKTGVMGWVWLLVPFGVCGYHGNGEERLRVVEKVGHFQ